jgi:hypothetical protein
MENILIVGPGGNYTAYVFGLNPEFYNETDYRLRNSNKAIEQVCFIQKEISLWRGEMAGGEFCGSAALGLAYLFSQETNILSGEFIFSGCDLPINYIVKDKTVSCNFFDLDHDKTIKKLDDFLFLVSLPGISHFVNFDENEGNANILTQKIIDQKLENLAAVGLIQVMKKDGNSADINPWVWVNKIDSLINETACISGAIAAAIVLQDNQNRLYGEYVINQPCGTPTVVSLTAKNNHKIAVNVSSKIVFLSLPQ